MNSNELVDKMETLAIKRGMQARIDELGHALAKAQAERDEWHSAHSIRSDELDGAIGMLNEARARLAELDTDNCRLINKVDVQAVELHKLEADKARLDWLEQELQKEVTLAQRGTPYCEQVQSLFRKNEPITRAAIDAARKEGA